MRPQFNSHPPYNRFPNNNNNRPQMFGNNTQTPQQQAMANPVNFRPNPVQMMPQFQMNGLLNNPQLPMQPFPNQNPFFGPNQFLPLNNNLQQQLLMQSAMNMLPQFQPPNLMQNANQLLQMQLANQMLANGQLGVVNFNGNGVSQSPVNGNDSKQVSHDSVAIQDNVGAVNGLKISGMNWQNSPNKSSNWNPKHNTSQKGHTKPSFHQGPKGNFKFHNKNKKEHENGAENFTTGSPKRNQEGKKRSLMLNYTAQEIQQWREDRRKNYPSQANKEKALKEKTEQDIADAATKARRQQLKEVLAKQAELGCEIADIPSNYLSDSEQQRNGRGANKRVFTKRERFQNKFDKRGKFHQNERFSYRQRPHNHGQANVHDQNDRFDKKQRLTNCNNSTNFRINNKREPSLLKKLLSSDINRDKKHLLQAFKFMVMNSFFGKLPEEPLKFPEVIVKEAGDNSVIIGDKADKEAGDNCVIIGDKAEEWKGEFSNGGTEIISNDEVMIKEGDETSGIDHIGGKVEEEGKSLTDYS